jgi:hypothetical protein
MDWVDLAQGRDQWRVLVKTVMNLWVPQNDRKFLSVYMHNRRLLKKGSAPWSYLVTVILFIYILNYFQ